MFNLFPTNTFARWYSYTSVATYRSIDSSIRQTHWHTAETLQEHIKLPPLESSVFPLILGTTPLARSRLKRSRDIEVLWLYSLHCCCRIRVTFFKCMLVVISYEKYIDFCHWPVMYRVSKAMEVCISKLSLNSIINFMEWNFTDAVAILKTSILTHCHNLIQISWRLASSLQNHSRKSVGHCARLLASLYIQN